MQLELFMPAGFTVWCARKPVDPVLVIGLESLLLAVTWTNLRGCHSFLAVLPQLLVDILCNSWDSLLQQCCQSMLILETILCSDVPKKHHVAAEGHPTHFESNHM
jgi:hypothetical protein